MKFVLFAGTTGFDKSAYIERFRTQCLRENGYDPESDESNDFIRYIKFEKMLVEHDGCENIDAFLKKFSSKEKFQAIEETFAKIARELSTSKADYVFFDVHLSYYKNSMFFPPFQKTLYESLTRGMGPSNIKIVTLIDDIFVVWKRLRDKIVDYPGTDLRLREIVAWRSLEMLQSETVAINLTTDEPVPAYLFAVRHPSYCLHNLIFRHAPKIGYLSYPITNTRKIQEYITDINEFRKAAHEIAKAKESVLFDPVTIDELILDLASQQNGSDDVELKSEVRWPVESNGLTDYSSLWPIRIPIREVTEVKADISNNIRTRDFKLVDSANTVAAYRPLLGGPSVGVKSELDYAIQVGRIPLVYDPDSPAGQGRHPFGQDIHPIRERGTFMDRLGGILSA